MDIAQLVMIINDLEVSAGSEDQIQAEFELKTDARSVLQSQSVLLVLLPYLFL